MIPTAYDDIEVLESSEQGTKTYKLCDDGHIRGTVEGAEALKQSIYCILSTQKYIHAIYSHSYGFDRAAVIGLDLPLGYVDIQDKITTALMADNRMGAVGDFVFSCPNKGIVHAQFTVTYTDGVQQNAEVTINV